MRKHLLTVAAVGLVAFLGACGSDDQVAPHDEAGAMPDAADVNSQPEHDGASDLTDAPGEAADASDVGSDATDGSPVDTAPDRHDACVYADASNDPGCPATYSRAYLGTPCDSPGLACAYPGAGDSAGNGCYATAMLWCTSDAGAADAGGADGGADAGGGTWAAAQ